MSRVTRRGAGEGWGRSLLAAVERAAGGARLARGRSHIRAGQVLSLRIAPGLIVGEVQGSQHEPFTATVTVRELDTEGAAAVVERVRGTPGTLAEVAAGRVPLELAGLLLPAGAAFDFGCTCPDPGTPCRHAAALVTVTADRMNDDPTLLLTLRGIDLDALLGVLDDEDADDSVDSADWFGDEAELPPLPRPLPAPAPRELNPVHLRAALRMITPEEDAARRAVRELDDLYRMLAGEQ